MQKVSKKPEVWKLDLFSLSENQTSPVFECSLYLKPVPDLIDVVDLKDVCASKFEVSDLRTMLEKVDRKSDVATWAQRSRFLFTRRFGLHDGGHGVGDGGDPKVSALNAGHENLQTAIFAEQN